MSLKLRSIFLFLAFAPSSGISEPSPYATINIAEQLLRAYKAEDGEALHRILTPALQTKYSVLDVQRILARCWAKTLVIDRLSIPSWGQRNYGFFGVYAELGVFDMILEIDNNEKIVHWVISDDITSTHQECVLSGD